MSSILPRVCGRTAVPPEVATAARQMLDELLTLKLQVCSNQGGYIRVVVCPNPDWYSRLCQQHLMLRPNRRWKRPRTIIRRVHTIRVLETLSEGWRGSGTCFDRVLDAVDWWRRQAGDAPCP